MADVVMPEPLSKRLEPLLNVLYLDQKGDKTINHSRFAPVHYKPLARHTIDSIHVQLRDTLGNLVDFMKGNTFLVLHFRRVE